MKLMRDPQQDASSCSGLAHCGECQVRVFRVFFRNEKNIPDSGLYPRFSSTNHGQIYWEKDGKSIGLMSQQKVSTSIKLATVRQHMHSYHKAVAQEFIEGCHDIAILLYIIIHNINIYIYTIYIYIYIYNYCYMPDVVAIYY